MRDWLLVRHFLFRFLDHDLISPDADRHQMLATAGAAIVASGLFIAFFLAVKYQFNLLLPPGLTSVLSLDDRFFLFALSMIAMALLAAAEWDALALDARDAAVLGPLPLTSGRIVRAKLAAVALFAIAFDVGLAIGPTVLRPVALPVRLPVTLAGAVQLTAAQAVCGLAAGAFGFLAMLGVHEFCRAVLGRTAFSRVSAAIQAALIVLLLTTLLLLPGRYSRVASRWMAGAPVPAAAVPPLWFVGLHEVLAGTVIDHLPRTAPPRFAVAEHEATVLYRSLQPTFHRLAAIAVTALGSVFLFTAVLCAWNHRRLPSETVDDRRSGLPTRLLEWSARRTIVRSAAGQAGFSFTIQTLMRRPSHRLTLAGFAALAATIALLVFNGLAAFNGHAAHPGPLKPVEAPLSAFAVQTLVLAVLLGGYRHLVRVPADPLAGWIFRLACPRGSRRFTSGSKQAALALLAAPALLMLAVAAVVVFGWRVAVAHAAFGGLTAALVIAILFVTYHGLPFATLYAGAGDLKLVAPLYAAAVLAGAAVLAASERAALESVAGSIALGAVLLSAIAILCAVDSRRFAPPLWLELEEPPAGATQRLDLNG